MNATQRIYLVNLNRLLIPGFTLTGLMMDGYQSADVLSSLAIVVWLWTPPCTRLEENLFKYLNHYNRGRNRSL